jgi:signal transduction histidine kinase
MVSTILSNPFVLELVLPFLLIFVLVFAILQKSKILGEGKTQIDAIVSLVVALIFIAVGKYTGIITNLIPIIAIALIVVLVFLLLLGSFFQGKIELNKNLNVILMILAAVVVVVALIYSSGSWDYIVSLFSGEGSTLFYNVLILIIIVIAVVAVIWGAKGESSGGGNKP